MTATPARVQINLGHEGRRFVATWTRHPFRSTAVSLHQRLLRGSCQRSIASGPTTAAASNAVSPHARARTPPKPTVCAGTGSIAAIPYNPTGQPGIWVAREGPTVVGHYPTLPVRVSLKGLEVDGAWGTDAMVAPERDRQGLDEALVRAWDRNSGAVLTLGRVGRSRGECSIACTGRPRTSCRAW